MARTIEQIQQSIISAKTADATLSTLTSTSNVAIWLLWTYIVAVCHWVLETLFDSHKAEVTDIIATQKPHTLQWYVTKTKQFQFGVTLPPETDSYAATTTDPAVAIIQYAAAVELSNLVRIKAATLSGGVLAPISSVQLNALTGYLNRIKDAGVRLQVTSNNPDMLRLILNIYYNPLVLNAAGERLDGTSLTPIKDAVNNFLANLPFNGLFVLNNLVAALQGIEGVVIGEIVAAAATYASVPYTPVTVEYTPDAGYMVLDEAFFNTNIHYFSHSPI